MLTKQGLTEYVGKYHMCSSGMYGGNMRHTCPGYTDGPRDVCWGSGIVAWDDFVMFVPFPIEYTVDGCSTKPRHIGISDTRAGDLIWHVCGINETHWTAKYRDSTGCVMGIWDYRIRRFYYVCTFSYSVYCVWVANKTATYRDPRYTYRDQLNIVLYVKNQE